MTIKFETQQGIDAGIAFCNTCNRHLEQVHKGYDPEIPSPLTMGELMLMDGAAKIHEKATKGEHDIRIIVYQRT